LPDLRVGIVGPESSGKTTLAHALREWLREIGITVAVIEEQGRALALDLPLGHAWGWREQRTTSLMHQAEEARQGLLLDLRTPPTALIADGTAATPLVWHMSAVRQRRSYDGGPPSIVEELLAAVEAIRYDVVLLMTPDLPWVPDGIRDDPDGRDQAFELYQTLYPEAVVVAGEDRFEQAQEAVTDRLAVR
jgi:nicotinamide riboside kinase